MQVVMWQSLEQPQSKNIQPTMYTSKTLWPLKKDRQYNAGGHGSSFQKKFELKVFTTVEK